MTVLQTERLRLRQASPNDAAFTHTLMNDPDFLHFVGDRKLRTVEDARAYLDRNYIPSYEKHGFGMWIVERHSDPEPIGFCGLLRREGMKDVEIGFAFLPAFRGQGYGRESASAVLDHGRIDLGLDRIVAITHPENTVSIRLLESLGMTFQGMIRPGADAREFRLFA